MPVFDQITVDTNLETIQNIMQRVIGDTQEDVIADIASVAAGGPTPALLLNGAMGGDTIPDVMLGYYNQLYNQAASIPSKTGLSYRASLAAGGSAPYAGQGS